jgi:signal peptidase I
MLQKAHLQAAFCDLVAEVARVSGQIQLKVAGTSMVPVLWPGDLLTISHSEPASLAPDSIIVFRQDDRLIVHRLLRREGAMLVTRGDARPCLDVPIAAADVVGRVETIHRDGRSVRLKQSVWQILVAAVLRRSENFTAFYLRLVSRFRRFGVSGAQPRSLNQVTP